MWIPTVHQNNILSHVRNWNAGTEDYFNVLKKQVARTWYWSNWLLRPILWWGIKYVKELAGEITLCALLRAYFKFDLVILQWKLQKKLSYFSVPFQQIYKFITESLPRLDILNQTIKVLGNESTSLSLKRYSETRWSSRGQCVDTMLSCLTQLHTSLIEIQTERRILWSLFNLQKHMRF